VNRCKGVKVYRSKGEKVENNSFFVIVRESKYGVEFGVGRKGCKDDPDLQHRK